MARVHEVLRWANRRAVAEEVTRRGYRVSGETLNRWVRDGKEFPAVVERIVFDLFTISGHNETAPPEWARQVAQETAVQIIEALAPLDLQQAARGVIERLEALPAQGGGAPDDTDASEDPAAAEPPTPASESRHGRE